MRLARTAGRCVAQGTPPPSRSLRTSSPDRQMQQPLWSTGPLLANMRNFFLGFKGTTSNANGSSYGMRTWGSELADAADMYETVLFCGFSTASAPVRYPFRAPSGTVSHVPGPYPLTSLHVPWSFQ